MNRGLNLGWLPQLRNYIYDSDLLDQTHADCPVISVGNLTMGGTGKTPMIQFLANELAKRGRRVAIISRNYKAQVPTFAQVDLNRPEGASYYGDEPWMLAQTLKSTDVYVTPRKFEASTIRGYDVLLIDDGFQHRALFRDLDIVLIDVSRSVQSLAMFPRGEAREPLGGIARANLVVLTKSEKTTPETLQEFETLIRKHYDGPIAAAHYVMELPELGGKKFCA